MEVHRLYHRQASQAICSEVHPQRGQGTQSLDPPAFPYLLQTTVIAMSFINHHDDYLHGIDYVLYIQYMLTVVLMPRLLCEPI